MGKGPQSKRRLRDPVNGLTHLTGGLLACAGLIVLQAKAASAGSIDQLVAFGIFGFSLVAPYTASALYHLLPLSPSGVARLRRLDHMTFFALIAGTYTPFCLLALDGAWRWGLLSLIWGLALCGVLLKLRWMGAPRWLSVALYLGMGWVAVVAVPALLRSLPAGGIAWVLTGGLVYNAAALVYGFKRPNLIPGAFGFHELWHLLEAARIGTRHIYLKGGLGTLDHLGSSRSFPRRSLFVPALPPYLIEPIWQQFAALLPEREVTHPLGCHRPRIPDRVVFEKLIEVLVFGCAYHRIADEGCSATTLRERRDEWIELGVIDTLREAVLEAYDRFIGLDLSEVAVDCCITKAPCGGEKAGRSSVDRGKRGIKRSMAVDASGIPLGAVSAPANRHDSPLLVPTLEHAGQSVGGLPEEASGHLDRGYDSSATRERLKERELLAEISQKGKPSPLGATKRWVVERTSSWHNAHKKLVWCTERRDGWWTSGWPSRRWSSS